MSDCTVSKNKFSSVTLRELAMKARESIVLSLICIIIVLVIIGKNLDISGLKTHSNFKPETFKMNFILFLLGTFSRSIMSY